MRFLLIPCLFSTLLVAQLSAQTVALLRAGDVFQMRLGGMSAEFAQEFNSEYSISQEGTVNIPLIGEIRVLGMTAPQLQKVIEQKFVAEKIFTQPSVNISVIQNMRSVIVGGSVRGPGRQQWSPDLTLSSAVSAAGGYTEWADKKRVRLIRENKIQVFDMRKIERDPALDPKLLPGDQITVSGD